MVAIGLAFSALSAYGLVSSYTLVGHHFPGFLVYEGRRLVDGKGGRHVAIADVGASRWAAEAPHPAPHTRLLSVDGHAVRSTDDLYSLLAQKEVGTLSTYRFATALGEQESVLRTLSFTTTDWLLAFASPTITGAVYLAVGLFIWMLQPSSALTRAFLAVCLFGALFLIPTPGMVSTRRFSVAYFQLSVIGAYMIPAAALQAYLLFPQRHRLAAWRFVGYPIALGLLAVLEVLFFMPAKLWFPWFWYVWFGVVVACIVWHVSVGALGMTHLVLAFRSVSSPLARQRNRVLLFALVVANVPPLLNSVYWMVTQKEFIAGSDKFLLWILLPLGALYAVLKHDFLEIDAMIKRATYYVVLTGVVATAYVLAATIFNVVLATGPLSGSLTLPIVFTLAVLLLFNPIRTRVQGLVDRFFLGERYDGAQLLAEAGLSCRLH